MRSPRTAALLDAAAQVRLVRIPGEPAPDGTLQRITEAAAAVLQRLKQTERDALRAEQLAWVGQMAAGIAHEVRNPLTSIKLLVQAATDPRRSAGFRPRDLQVLEGEILRLEQIISTFLDFARPPRPDKKSVAVPGLLTECLAGVRARAELQNVDVRLDVAEPVPPVDADSGQIRQVVYNLMFNASASFPTAARSTFAWGRRRARRAGRRALSSASRTRPGLPPGLRTRSRSLRSTGYRIGLGLSISRRIVETHGGSIDAKTGPTGGGSSRSVSAAFRARWHAERLAVPPELEMPKLLIIDDEPGILYSLRASLRTMTPPSSPRPPRTGSPRRPATNPTRSSSMSDSTCPASTPSIA